MEVAGGGEWVVQCVSRHGGAWRCVAVRGGGGGGGMGWLDFLRVWRVMLVRWGAVVRGEVG